MKNQKSQIKNYSCRTRGDGIILASRRRISPFRFYLLEMQGGKGDKLMDAGLPCVEIALRRLKRQQERGI